MRQKRLAGITQFVERRRYSDTKSILPDRLGTMLHVYCKPSMICNMLPCPRQHPPWPIRGEPQPPNEPADTQATPPRCFRGCLPSGLLSS